MVTGIVLAAGSGKRMNSQIQKQFLEVHGRPLIYYALKAFEESCVDRVILVTGADSVEYCRREIVDRYVFLKVLAVVPGGSERYHSVYNGLEAAKGSDYVLIHDGARPMVTPEMINRLVEEVREHKACISGVPTKDTIKITDAAGIVESTPERSRLWTVHTPQAFEYSLICAAHKRFRETGCPVGVTDDGMLVEAYTDQPVKMIAGSYANIKVTTPEDLPLAAVFLQGRWISRSV
jgi:2-C-methyl-D-erythritol 4-phosphate cytidylyltransferase